MPEIRPSSDLRNKYNEISQFCHEYSEPVYLTKNGKGDLAVMSIDTYEQLVGKFELYNLLAKGEESLKNDEAIPADEAFKRIEDGLTE
ncbi:type II toxin-antitoxin system Phd/YefM family antitoxin [Sporolactobacillus sp. STCC-11]|uniref:type II toxin-antitoxin system Phd/YefM family antitoxin n=1 Tax=Sporolactobacillus caesalpiniae TaxID=3230362 RepID=UPI0033957155